MPWKVAARDASLIVVTLVLWVVDARLRTRGSGWLPLGVASATGVMTALSGFIAHEWGHFLGARMSRSVVRLPAHIGTVFLFNFDSDRNSRRQFLAMSGGGFLASAVVIGLLLSLLPLAATSSRIALSLVGLGVVATLALEVPPAWRVARGGSIPRGGVYASTVDGSPSYPTGRPVHWPNPPGTPEQMSQD